MPPPPPSGPSTLVKVLAVFQIIFGVIGMLGAPVGLLVANLRLSSDPLQVKLHELLWEGPAAIWSYTHIALGFLFAIALLATGIGLLRGKLWARTTGIVYGIGTLLANAIGQLVMFVYVYPMLLEATGATNRIERAGAMGGLIGGAFTALLGSVLPTLTLVVLGRRSIKEQLQSA